MELGQIEEASGIAFMDKVDLNLPSSFGDKVPGTKSVRGSFRRKFQGQTTELMHISPVGVIVGR